jgi:hypothetical protein
VYNLVASKQSTIEKLGTKGTLADIMAKPISGTSFKTSRSAMEICGQKLLHLSKALQSTSLAHGIARVSTRCTTTPRANQQRNVTASKAKRDTDQAVGRGLYMGCRNRGGTWIRQGLEGYSCSDDHAVLPQFDTANDC